MSQKPKHFVISGEAGPLAALDRPPAGMIEPRMGRAGGHAPCRRSQCGRGGAGS